MSLIRIRIAGMVGNLLEHYDRALFGLLTPFIAPLFFGDKDPITALILTFAILPLTLLARPLGALFFGWIGDRFSRKEALFWSLSGAAIATVWIGCLPGSSQIGLWAPILLSSGKALQNFFDGGETTGGAILVLESTESKKRSLFSSFYDLSTLLGILLASAAVALFCRFHLIETSWRVLFWAGGATGLAALYFRYRLPLESQKRPSFRLNDLFAEKKALLSILFASGFSYTTYSIPFILMNGFLPLISPITKTEAMEINTALMALDFFLLPCFGWMAQKIGKEKMMTGAALMTVLCAVPLFSCLDGGGLLTAIAVRVAFVVLGVAFAAPYHAWALEQTAPAYRFTLLSVGYALGTQLIGVPSTALCLLLYKQTGWVWMPGLYFAASAAAAYFAVARRKTSPVQATPF